MENGAGGAATSTDSRTEVSGEESALGRIKEAVSEGDKFLSPAWIVLQLALSFAMFVLMFYNRVNFFESIYYRELYKINHNYYNLQMYAPAQNFQVGNVYLTLVYGLLAVLLEIVNIYIILSLISRRNKHLERTRKLYTSLADYLELKGEDTRFLRELIVRERVENGNKNTAGWTILSIIPVINIFALPYIYHFLTRDYFRHSVYEKMVLECVFDPLGVKSKVVKDYPDRDTVMYYLLSVVTLGIAWIYWLYTLFADPNEHFREHAVIEQEILRSLNVS